MRFNFLVVVFLSFFLVGCTTKREYFSPEKEEISGDFRYTQKLDESIVFVTAKGATLEDGSVITKDGALSKIKLDKNEKFLTIAENKVLSSNIDGTFKIRDLDGNIVFEHKFPVQVISANLRGDDLALVSVDNTRYLMKMSSKTMILEEKNDIALAYDSRVAKPLFAGSGVIAYPMLDGRVAIIHAPTGGLVQEIFVSSEPFFNSVIYLDIVGDNLYAATGTVLLLNTATGNKRALENIRDIFKYQNKIYIFNEDGNVKIYDMNLNKLREKKFRFAIFSAAMPKDGSIYIFEKTGYLIKTDLNLENEQIFELDDEIDELSFINEFAFYYDDEYAELK
ncbi:MAG: hypothetical protein GX282_06005 [Campylobacteraceae bacterium]|nr:hypothetical protein [Campylobacteraceae bacterium]